ncbi:MAG: hypothetical protein IPJ33_09700 [Gammaproteobacteria bacterium]|nr:hypothetical protein [Gammaproteobacteria bacterium]
MKKILVTLAGVTAIVLAAGSAQAAYVETFDADNASWLYGYGTNFASPQNNATWIGSGGNSDGHISGDASNLYAIWTYTTAPYGDMTGLTMTIDTKVTGTPTGNAQFYIGRGGSYFVDGTWAIGSDTSWTTHSTAMTATEFTFWTQSINNTFSLAQVLAAPDDIGIFFGGVVTGGSGQVSVDNFGVSAVPLPGAALLFGSVLAGLGFTRRYKQRNSLVA